MGIINKDETLIPGKSTELVPINDSEIDMRVIKESDLPKIINGQIQKLNELEKSVTEAIAKAEKANISAGTAYNKSAGLFKKKAAIESLQDAVYDQAQAVMSQAEAQRVSFEFQTKLAEISKFLFNLGISNIALNRSTVRQLQLKMEGASKAELSELAKKEILTVIKQLKAQEDLLAKHLKLEEGAKQHDKQLKVLTEHDRKKTKKLSEQAKIVETHDELLENNIKKIKSTDKKVKSNYEMIQSLNEITDNHNHSLIALKRSFKKLNDKATLLDQANVDLTDRLHKHKTALLIIGIVLSAIIVLVIRLLGIILMK